jgi:ABC-type branched-subunit amino acid transport system substrate-binding protein
MVFLIGYARPWSGNLTAKIAKTPKAYLTDSGLAANLVQVTPDGLRRPGNAALGGLVETFVFNELTKAVALAETAASIHNFRDRDGREIDFILETRDGRIVAIEVKASASPGDEATRHLRWLRDRLGDRFVIGIMLYLGEHTLPHGDRVLAVPLSALWGHPPPRRESHNRLIVLRGARGGEVTRSGDGRAHAGCRRPAPGGHGAERRSGVTPGAAAGMTGGTPDGMGTRRLRVGCCLSLSGRYARFGRQAAAALEVWRAWDDAADLIVEDDRGDPRELRAALVGLAPACDVLIGPYSTYLMRTAGDVAADLDRLIWNHGGSGDDVEAAHPGHVVSVPTPAGGYAEPYVRRLARDRRPGRLWLAQGRGGFGRQVVAGAEAAARAAGVETVRIGPDDPLPATEPADGWHLFAAGSYEEDVQMVQRARQAPRPPRTICAVAAGVREFGAAVERPEGIYGVGQWFPGGGHAVALGPAEPDFMTAFARHAGFLPDYPAAQAAAAAVIAAHCVRHAGSTDREPLWAAAAALETTTFFGIFRINPENGVQIGHRAALTRWTRPGPTAA